MRKKVKMRKKFTNKPLKRKVTRNPNFSYPYPDDGGSHRPNLNFVCFGCRFVSRDSSIMEYGNQKYGPTCPHCRKLMINMFCKIEIPRKTNDHGWKVLERNYKEKYDVR